MTEVKVNSQSPEEKLLALGIPNKNIVLNVAVLRVASSPEKLREEIIKRRLSCDEEQFLLPMFRPLYQRDLQTRETALEQLAESVVPKNIINDYFVNYGDQPYMALRLKEENDKLNEKAKDRLIEQAKQVMLTALRDHLGFSPRKTETKT